MSNHMYQWYAWANYYTSWLHFRWEVDWTFPKWVLELFITPRNVDGRYGLRVMLHFLYASVECEIFPKGAVRWDGKELFGLDVGRRINRWRGNECVERKEWTHWFHNYEEAL